MEDARDVLYEPFIEEPRAESLSLGSRSIMMGGAFGAGI